MICYIVDDEKSDCLNLTGETVLPSSLTDEGVK